MATRARAIADEMENLRMGGNRDLINKFLVGIGRTPRTEEEMGELTREIQRAPNVRNPINALENMPEPNPGQEYSAERTTQAASKKTFAKGGKVSSASKRADGIAQRGKTKGTYL